MKNRPIIKATQDAVREMEWDVASWITGYGVYVAVMGSFVALTAYLPTLKPKK